MPIKLLLILLFLVPQASSEAKPRRIKQYSSSSKPKKPKKVKKRVKNIRCQTVQCEYHRLRALWLIQIASPPRRVHKR